MRWGHTWLWGVLRRLNAPEGFIDHVATLVDLHLIQTYTPEWSDGAIRRLQKNAGNAFDDLNAPPGLTTRPNGWKKVQKSQTTKKLVGSS